MAIGRDSQIPGVGQTIRQVSLAALVFFCLVLFVLWRIDNPRVEQMRMALIDAIAPSLEITSSVFGGVTRRWDAFQAYSRVYEQNENLRRQLLKMKGWRELAIQLEQENARLRALNNVHLSPRLSFTTGEIMADSGGPFRQSVLTNIGRRDAVLDGSASVDGLGLVGRVSGVGEDTARIILLTDTSSRIPVVLRPSGRRAIVAGDNSDLPRLDFPEAKDLVKPGDRVFTTGDGGVFPPDILVGEISVGVRGTLRVRLAADYQRLEFVRVLRYEPRLRIDGPGELIGPTNQTVAVPPTGQDE